jgi:hypothetical protein
MMRARFAPVARIALLVAVVAAQSCNATTAPDLADSQITPAVFTTQTFAGSLATSGSLFYSIVVTQRGPVSLTLAAVQTPGGGALTTPIGIGVGIPKGTGCPRTSSIVTPPGLAAQLTVTLNPGTYCAAVYDVGNLSSAANFAMRITYP